MWTGALSALPSPVPIHPEGVRFTPGQADEVIAAIGDALAEAELTVDELTEALADRPGPWAVERTMDAFQDKWPRWRQLTSTAAHRGVLCFGPDRGRKVTYTNPHRWLPGFRPADGEEALRTLVTRYLHAYGPATPAALRQVDRRPAAARRRAVRRAGPGAGERRAGRRAGLDRAGDTDDAVRAAPRGPPAALLRPVRGRGPAPGAALPGRGRRPRAHPVGPGRELPGPAGRRSGRRGLAPAALRPQARHHGGAAARADRDGSAANSTTRPPWWARSWRPRRR